MLPFAVVGYERRQQRLPQLLLDVDAMHVNCLLWPLVIRLLKHHLRRPPGCPVSVVPLHPLWGDVTGPPPMYPHSVALLLRVPLNWPHLPSLPADRLHWHVPPKVVSETDVGMVVHSIVGNRVHFSLGILDLSQP